jgi:hypothetical protein
MKAEEFNNLSKEEQQKEIEKCQSFEYFYNNYCWREGMPKYSEESWQEYVENNNRKRFSRRRMGNTYFYPFTPEEAFKN